jgi:hypothetical protein
LVICARKNFSSGMVTALAGNVIALVLGSTANAVQKENERRPEKWTARSLNHRIIIGCGSVRG